jgi:hypothetical protein
MEGNNLLVNSVLPYTNPDYVAYSMYDSEGPGSQALLQTSLDYIQAHIQPKADILGKRVIIAETGYSSYQYGEQEAAALTMDGINAATAWGCPFIIDWQYYSSGSGGNEQDIPNGYWLVDSNGVYTPLYYDLQVLVASGAIL